MAHQHTFDPVSGWCTGCIGYREDGRLMSFGGNELRNGKNYTPQELENLRQKASTR